MDQRAKITFSNRVTSFFYALAITVGIFIAIQELHYFKNTANFISFSAAILFIYVVEMFTGIRNKSRSVQINFDIHDEVNEMVEIFHKILLPIGLYFSIVGFGYYNILEGSIWVILGITFFSFFILILNTKVFLENLKKEELKTHYIYDVVKFLIFFLLVNTGVNFFRSEGGNIAIISILIGLLSLTIINLMTWRIGKFSNKVLGYSFISSLITGLTFYLASGFNRLNPLQVSIAVIFIFYIAAAIIHHKLMNTLTSSVVLEYILVMGVILAIVYGIS